MGWTVKLWDMTTRVNFATLGHTSAVYSVAFSPMDNPCLRDGGGTVELWDTSGLMGVRLEATAEIDIPDPNLRAAIAEAIGLPPSTLIVGRQLCQSRTQHKHLTGEGATMAKYVDPESLEARNANISRFWTSGLKDCNQLENNCILGTIEYLGTTRYRISQR